MSNLVTVLEGGETQIVPAEEINISNVKNIIYKNDHPHPVAIAALAAVLIIFMYYVYVAFIKPCFGGQWLTHGEHSGFVKIEHNKWNDTVWSDSVGAGFVNGAAIYLHDGAGKTYAGVLYNNNIYWVGGAIWKRPVKL